MSSQMLLLVDFKAFGEGGVGESQIDLSVALGFLGFALAVFAAEADLRATDFHGRVRIQFSAGQRAFDLGGLTCGKQLMIGLGRVLGCFFCESRRAVAAAEIDLGPLVICGLVFKSGLTGNRAGGLEWLGLFFSGKGHETDSQNRTNHHTDFSNRHEKNLSYAFG